jgi:hypothetical protein
MNRRPLCGWRFIIAQAANSRPILAYFTPPPAIGGRQTRVALRPFRTGGLVIPPVNVTLSERQRMIANGDRRVAAREIHPPLLQPGLTRRY